MPTEFHDADVSIKYHDDHKIRLRIDTITAFGCTSTHVVLNEQQLVEHMHQVMDVIQKVEENR